LENAAVLTQFRFKRQAVHADLHGINGSGDPTPEDRLLFPESVDLFLIHVVAVQGRGEGLEFGSPGRVALEPVVELPHPGQALPWKGPRALGFAGLRAGGYYELVLVTGTCHYGFGFVLYVSFLGKDQAALPGQLEIVKACNLVDGLLFATAYGDVTFGGVDRH